MASRQGAFSSAGLLDSHPSLAASMEDFEAREFSPTVPDLPSQHSGFRSNVSSYQSSTSSNRRSDSPPAWRKAGSGWFKQQASLSPTRGGYGSREPSPEYHSADDEVDREGEVTVYPLPSRIPLPESPTKGRSISPSPDPAFGGGDAYSRAMPLRDRQITPPAHSGAEMETTDQTTPTQMNCELYYILPSLQG